jgi:hypothetical protein
LALFKTGPCGRVFFVRQSAAMTDATTRWKQLAVTSDLDAEGILHTSMHVMEVGSGEDFTITFSGRGAADTGYFIGALLTCAQALKKAAGDDSQFPSVSYAPPNKGH